MFEVVNQPEVVDPTSIVVAIPAWNEASFIEHTLDVLMDPGAEAAGQETVDMSKVLIVVADGGSTDGMQDIVNAYSEKHPNVRLIHNPAKRQSAAVNLVVDTCTTPEHKYMVRVDAHAEYPAGYVVDVVRSLQAQGADAVATVMDSIGTTCFQKGSAWAVDTKLGSGGSGHRGGATSGWVDHGHHAGFTLDIWKRTGGYDPEYAANEDAELDHRIQREGGRIWLDADIRLGYYMRPNLKKLARQYWLYGRGRARTTFRHKSMPKLRQIIPALAVVGNVGALILAPVTPVFLFIPVLYFTLLAAATCQLLVRHKSLCALWAGPALFAMHMWWGAGFLWHAATRQGRAA